MLCDHGVHRVGFTFRPSLLVQVKEKPVVLICEDANDPILRGLPTDLLVFRSNEEYDAWRTLQRCPNNLLREVEAALNELGVEHASLPDQMKDMLNLIALCEIPASVAKLHEKISRRTLYRYWDARLDPPAQFLMRIRVLRAQTLATAANPDLKAVALAAGFGNVHRMKVAASRFGKTIR